jgi:hypothetical protein
MQALQRRQMPAGMSLDVLGYLPGVGERDRWIDGQRHFGVQAMTKPPRTNRLDAQYASYMLCGVAELTCDLGLDAIEHPRQHGLGRLPNDPEDYGRYDEADDRRVRRHNSAPRVTSHGFNLT